MTDTHSFNIHVPFPETGSSQLQLKLAACRLTLSPGKTEPWVTGTYDDLDGSLPLHLQRSGGIFSIIQRETLAESLRLESRLAPLDLTLGTGQRFGLTLDAGLLETHADLGGLSLTSLEIKPGKGRQEIRFSAPNPEPMRAINIHAGKAHLEMRSLGNANFANLNVDCGEADCLFDFGGKLQRPAESKITIPQGSVEILVPAATAARVTVESFGAVDIDNGFTRQKGSFWNQAALAGQVPVLTIRATVLSGSVRLRNC